MVGVRIWVFPQKSSPSESWASGFTSDQSRFYGDQADQGLPGITTNSHGDQGLGVRIWGFATKIVGVRVSILVETVITQSNYLGIYGRYSIFAKFSTIFYLFFNFICLPKAGYLSNLLWFLLRIWARASRGSP